MARWPMPMEKLYIFWCVFGQTPKMRYVVNTRLGDFIRFDLENLHQFTHFLRLFKNLYNNKT